MKRVLLLLACAAAALPAAGASAGPTLTGHTWLLESLRGKPPVAGTAVTMRFVGDRVEGFAGCNGYAAAYTTRAARGLRIGAPVASTRIACVHAVEVQESAFLSMLGAVRRYALNGGDLTLKSAAGRALARFAVESQELGGTSWRVLSYNNGKGAVTSVTAGTRLTASFVAGKVSGFAGCNIYDATYTAAPPKLSLGPVAQSRKACSTPANVMTQEAAYLAALATTATYAVEAGKLELRTASGALAVQLARAA